MDIALQKNALRAEIRKRLKGLAPESIAEQSAAACGRVAAMREFKEARLILAYMAMPKECSPETLVKRAKELGKEVAFPKCVEGNRLELYVTDEFAPGAYGIMEPDPSRGRPVRPGELGLIIAPGVAFDSKCNRLGHGAGYYDRLLMEAKAPVVGLALEEQLVRAVPVGEHDRPVDYVAWRNGIYCK